MAAVQENNGFEGFTKEMHETTRKIRTELLKVQDIVAKQSEQLFSDNSEDEEEKCNQYDPRLFEDEKFSNDDNHLTKDATLECGKKHKKNEKNADENHESELVAVEVSPSDWKTENMLESHLPSCKTEDTAEKTEEENLIYCRVSESEPLTPQACRNETQYTKPFHEEFEGFTHDDQECSTLNTGPPSQDLFHTQEDLLSGFIQPLKEFEGFTWHEREHSNKKKNACLKLKKELGESYKIYLTQARKWAINFQEKLTKQDRQQLWEMKERQYSIMSHLFVNDHIEWLKKSQVMLKQSFSSFPKNFTQYQDLVELEVAVYKTMIMGSRRRQQLTTKDLYTNLHQVIRNKISELQMEKLLLMSPLYYYDISKKIWQRTSEVLETGKSMINRPRCFLFFVNRTM